MPTWATEGELMAPSLDSTKVAKSKEVGCMSKLLEEVATVDKVLVSVSE